MSTQAMETNPLTELVSFASFEDLLSGAAGVAVSDTEARNVFFETGRSLILAPAGAGKSTLLHRLSSGTDSVIRSLPAVLATSVGGNASRDFRRWLMNTVRRAYGSKLLLCLDGLDEIRPLDAQIILDAVEEQTRKDPKLAIVLTDRVTRRAVQLDRWALFGIASRDGEPLRSWEAYPFFRDAGVEAINRSDAINQMTRLAAPSLESSLDAVAGKAFEWLIREESTAAPSEEVRSLLGDAVVEDLAAADLLSQTNDASAFTHPLYHAYFAAQHIRSRIDAWHEDTWDALSVEGANFSALGLLLEQVDGEEVEHLVRAVDRWNYLAAASLLAEDLAGANRIPPDLRSALLLLLGHRRFSPSLSTSVFAGDMLRLQVGDPLAARILEAESRNDLTEIAGDLPDYGEWWGRWRGEFRSTDAANLVQSLGDDDYLLAWTASNVLSSSDHERPIQERLLGIAFNDGDDDTRWRALHALGSSTDPWVAQQCLTVFRTETEDEWVRYGALRAFLQVLALIPDDARRDLCEQLASEVGIIRGKSRWEREIERAAELRDAPNDWSDTFGLVIGALWTGAGSLEEEDRWRAAAVALQIDDAEPFAAALRPVTGEEQT